MPNANDDQGMTLVELLIALLLLTTVTTGLLLVVTQGLRTQALSERTDRITGLTQVVMSKAREVDFAQLGYYTADGVASGNATVPVSPVTAGAVGPSVTEQRVILGASRPPGTTPFAPAVQTITNDSGVNYRVTTNVTWVPNPGGVGVPTAKRVTVTTQWAPYPTSLTGVCSQEHTRCTTNSFIRTATASDLDPVTGTSPTSTCTPGAAIICEAYIRAGRVLDGSTMITATDTPEQVSPVDMFVRTASTATAVKATWTWKNAEGGVVKTVTQPLTGGADGTRWTAELAPDNSGPTSTYKGDIHPGAVTVTFTATIGGSPVSVTRPAFWSYAAADGANSVTANVVDAANWCSPVGAAAPIVFGVQGHSIGFAEGTQNPSASDRVDVVFTTTTGGVTRTETVPATVVPGSVVAENQSQNGAITGGWVDAQWTVAPPATEQCDNRSVSLIVHRAIDQTSTPIALALPATTPVIPTVDPPAASIAGAGASAGYTVSWTAPNGSAGYILEVTEQGEAPVNVTTTALSYAGTLDPGQSVTAHVKATTRWSTSEWSNTVTTTRAPAQPQVTAVRTANQMTFSWPAVQHATDYWVTIKRGSGQWTTVGATAGTSYMVTSSPGETVALGVVARVSGQTSATATATATVPLWDDMVTVNGWVDYGGAHAPARYSRTVEGIVLVEGLVRYGTNTTYGSPIATLPPGYRPPYRLIFAVAQNGTKTGRLDIDVNGDIMLTTNDPANAVGWISLNSIAFPAADSSITMQTLTGLNSWSGYGPPFTSVPRGGIDPFGRVWMQGLIRNGAVANNTPMVSLPAGWQPTTYHHLSTTGNDAFSAIGVGAGYGFVAKGYQAAGWTSIEAMWHSSSSTATWTAMGLAGGWAQYAPGSIYTVPGYTKAGDGIVSLRGLIAGGSTAVDSVITTLPAGYCPDSTLIFDVASNGHYGRVDVLSDCRVIVREGVDAAWVSLDSIAFRADH